MSYKLVIVRQDEAAAPPTEHLCQEPMISIGSDASASIPLAGIAAEQVVLLFEHSVPILVNRAEGTRLNEELLIREAHRPFNIGDVLRFGKYIINLTPVQGLSLTNQSPVVTPVAKALNKAGTPLPGNETLATFDATITIKNPAAEAASNPAAPNPTLTNSAQANAPSVTPIAITPPASPMATDASSTTHLPTPPPATPVTPSVMTPLVAVSPAEAAKQSTTVPPVKDQPRTKNFSQILDSLRTEEDSYYFRFETGAQTGARIVIDKADMVCGWDLSGTQLTTDAEAVAAPRMTIRKDWTGVVIQAHAAGMVRVNDELTVDARRLRTADRISLAPPADAPGAPFINLIFNEPVSLAAIDTLLPQPLPPPVIAPLNPVVAPTSPEATSPTAAAATDVVATPVKAKKKKHPPREANHRYFGYFTRLELGIMLISTLIAAAIVFFVLEYA